jgi:hypothetical protein
VKIEGPTGNVSAFTRPVSALSQNRNEPSGFSRDVPNLDAGGPSFSRRFDGVFIRKDEGVLQIEGIWEAEDTVKLTLALSDLKKGEQNPHHSALGLTQSVSPSFTEIAMTKVSIICAKEHEAEGSAPS